MWSAVTWERERTYAHDAQDQHLRHHAARRRAVAGRFHEHRGETRRRASASAPERGRHRGGLPHFQPWRLRKRAPYRRIGGGRGHGVRTHACGGERHRCGGRRAQVRQASAHPHGHRREPQPHARQAAHHRGRMRGAHHQVRVVRQEVRGGRAILRRGCGAFRLRLPSARHPGGGGCGRNRGQHSRHHGLFAARRVRAAHQVPDGGRARHRKRDGRRALPQRLGHGYGPCHGGREERRHPDRVHDQRSGRARGQHRHGGSGHGHQDARAGA